MTELAFQQCQKNVRVVDSINARLSLHDLLCFDSESHFDVMRRRVAFAMGRVEIRQWKNHNKLIRFLTVIGSLERWFVCCAVECGNSVSGVGFVMGL